MCITWKVANLNQNLIINTDGKTIYCNIENLIKFAAVLLKTEEYYY